MQFMATGIKKLKPLRGEVRGLPSKFLGGLPLWQMDIVELAGHNIEAQGRKQVNKMLKEGWILLYIYTLKYRENGEWRQRPMAILGRPRI